MFYELKKENVLLLVVISYLFCVCKVAFLLYACWYKNKRNILANYR